MSPNISIYHACPVVNRDSFEVLLLGSPNILHVYKKPYHCKRILDAL